MFDLTLQAMQDTRWFETCAHESFKTFLNFACADSFASSAQVQIVVSRAESSRNSLSHFLQSSEIPLLSGLLCKFYIVI